MTILYSEDNILLKKKQGGGKLILINELRGKIKAKGYTQEKLAKELGISPKTLSKKINKGIFGSDEIEKMIKILGIENPMGIFFAK